MLPTEIIQYLKSRGLSDYVISRFEWRNGRIWLPIRMVNGTMLGKSRRNPFVDDGSPKYVCDTGLSRTLFLAHRIPQASQVFVCEGEFDALALYSLGFCAVSSTTGAGSWNSGWDRLFTDSEVIFCYDSDEAGRRGAKKAAAGVARYAAKCRILVHDGSCGKDVSDWLSWQVKNDGGPDWLKFIRERCSLEEPPKYVPPHEYKPNREGKLRTERHESCLEIAERFGIKLRKVGAEFVGLSPFRNEKQASFAINPQKNVWMDYGLGEGGGAKRLKEMLGL